MRIVLASESPFRRHAMDMLGLAYEVFPSKVDEKAIRDDDPAELTRKLAEIKARKVASEHPDAVVVSGDAVAAKDGRIFEKPHSLEEAAQFLRELSGSEFQFVTSLAVMNAVSGKMLSTVEASNIKFRELVETEIHAYIRKYEVLRYRGRLKATPCCFSRTGFRGAITS